MESRAHQHNSERNICRSLFLAQNLLGALPVLSAGGMGVATDYAEYSRQFSDHIESIVLGRSRAISTSKIKKFTAIRKNHNEKGSRAELFWIKGTFLGGGFFLVFNYFFLNN